MPSKPLPLKTFQKMLSNPYYKGIVTYKGVEYPGVHEPIIDGETYDTVQKILASRINGERNYKHPHFLKGTLYCACCGSRMCITNSKKIISGTEYIYPYFFCIGRQSKSHPECKSRFILVADVEKKVEQLYDNIQLPHEIREAIEAELQEVIKKEKEKFDIELDGLLGQKRVLEHKSEKLLEAHYNDAIPLPLLKEEQQKISKQLSAIEYEIKQRNVTFEQITQNLTDALDLLDDCAAFYRNSNDTIKRLLNQAIFEKIYISCEKGSPVKVEAEFNPPFDMLVEPFTDELIKVNRAIRMGPDKTIEKINKAKDRILKNLRCGLSDSENKEPYSDADFFTYKFVSKALLVERTRLEDLRLAETLEK